MRPLTTLWKTLVFLIVVMLPLRADDEGATVSITQSDTNLCALASDGSTRIVFARDQSTCGAHSDADGSIDRIITFDLPLTGPLKLGAFTIFPVSLKAIHPDMEGIIYRLEYGDLAVLFLPPDATSDSLRNGPNCDVLRQSLNDETAYNLDSPMLVMRGQTTHYACLIKLISPHFVVTKLDQKEGLVQLGLQPNNILSVNSPAYAGTACQFKSDVEISLRSDGTMTAYRCHGS